MTMLKILSPSWMGTSSATVNTNTMTYRHVSLGLDHWAQWTRRITAAGASDYSLPGILTSTRPRT